MTTVSQVSERQEVERYAAGSRAAGRLGRVKIATRQSLLALWQAEHVRDRLQQLYPGLTVELVPMTTRGDQILDRSLAKIGGKGLFIKELEVAMEAGEADLAVHSCKDVPMALPDGFTLAAMLVREDPRDALLTPRGSGISALDGLAANAVVGTSSLRREAQLRERFPHLQVQPLRGNVDTRIAKLDRGEYAAIILAAAGIKRLGWADRISGLLAPEQSLPAVGQGAVTIEIESARADLMALLTPLDHADTAHCVRAERAVSAALGGSCQVPLAAHGTLRGDQIELRGLVASPDGKQVVRASMSGPRSDPEALGFALAEKLRGGGAEKILAALKHADD